MTRNAINNRLDRERGHDDPPDGMTVGEWLAHRARVRTRERLYARLRARAIARSVSRDDIDRATDLYGD